jgi:hypothetical protein
MSFFQREAWTVRFLELDAKTSIGRIRTFATADKVRELIARTPTLLDLAGKQALEHAIRGGRGGIYLELTVEQYRKLRR